MKSTHHQMKECERKSHHVTEGNCQCLWEDLQKLYDDQEHEETEKENEENENESSIDVQNKDTSEMMRIPEITTEELQTAINRVKKGKSADSNGIRAKDIKACDDETKEMVRQIFNEIVKQNEFTPEAWREVRLKVIHEKRDVEDVRNYRPICSLQALYKLFMTTLYSRLYPRLDPMQAEDQEGFRSSYQTTDHLATYRMMNQKCHEWRIKIWPTNQFGTPSNLAVLNMTTSAS